MVGAGGVFGRKGTEKMSIKGNRRHKVVLRNSCRWRVGVPMVAELPHTTWGGCSAARCLPGLGLPHSSSTQAQQQPWMRPVGCKQSSQPCSDVSPSAQSHLCRPMSAKPSLVPEALCCSVSLQSSIRHRTPPIHTTWSSKQRQRCQLRPHGLCPTLWGRRHRCPSSPTSHPLPPHSP